MGRIIGSPKSVQRKFMDGSQRVNLVAKYTLKAMMHIHNAIKMMRYPCSCAQLPPVQLLRQRQVTPEQAQRRSLRLHHQSSSP
jgi:hypothetical protein